MNKHSTAASTTLVLGGLLAVAVAFVPPEMRMLGVLVAGSVVAIGAALNVLALLNQGPRSSRDWRGKCDVPLDLDPAGGAQPWGVGEAIGVGWNALREHFFLIVIAWALAAYLGQMVGGTAGASALSSYLRALRTSEITLGGGGVNPARVLVGTPGITLVFGILANFAVGVFLRGGLTAFWLRAARGEPLSVAQIFRGGRFFLRLFVYSLLALLLGTLSCIPLIGFAFLPIGLGLLMTPYYVVDRNCSLGEAMDLSWKVTRGHKFPLFVLSLASTLIVLCGYALFGIGALAALPLTQIGFAYVYLRLSGRSTIASFAPEFGDPYARALPSLLFFVSTVGFTLLCLRILGVPEMRGAAFSVRETAMRAGAVLLGVAMTISFLASILPWLLDRLEGGTFVSFVAARHVRSPKSGFLTVISVLSICGVAIGSCSLSTVVSVMGGFSSDLKRKILGNNAHIVIDTTSQITWADYDGVLDRVRKVPGVVAATPVVHGEVMVSSASNLAGVMVRGIDPDSIGSVIELPRNIEVGKLDYLSNPEKLLHLSVNEVIGVGPGGEPYTKGPEISTLPDDIDKSVKDALRTTAPIRPGIIIGRELAKTLHVYVGDEVTLVSPLGDLGPMGVMPRTKKFRIAAIFYSGMYEYDANQVYTTIEMAQEYFTAKGKISAIDVKVQDAENADQMTPKVAAAVSRTELRTRDWREINKNLFSALKLERFATFIILSIAILVASFCIVSTLLLMVTEKAKEIAILKAIGASDGGILRTFITEGIIIGGIGTIFGVATSLALCTGLSWFGLRLDPDVYYIDRLPVHVSGWDFLAVTGAALVICTLATIFPAYAASKLRPVDGLRYE